MGVSRGCVFILHKHPPPQSSGLHNFKADILIDNSSHACLADFGSLTITSDELTITSSVPYGGAIRWTSPELLDPEGFGFTESCPTKESDCFALGMVVYEVLSGQVPFRFSREFVAMQKIIEGLRPERPEGEIGMLFTDGIWDLVQLCWAHQPAGRISASDVLLGLGQNSSPFGPSSNVDGDVGTNAIQPDATASNPGMLSSFHPKLVVSYTCDIIGLLAIHGDNGPPVPPLDSPPSTRTSSVTPRDSGPLPDQPQSGASKKGQIIRRLVRNTLRVIKVTAKKYSGR